MIKNTKHPDNPPSLWDEATEDKLCTQKKTVNRYAGYLTDPVNGHKTPSGGTLAIGTATDYLQDFLQSLNARFITSDRAETKLPDVSEEGELHSSPFGQRVHSRALTCVHRTLVVL
jgi:hypothetical protein